MQAAGALSQQARRLSAASSVVHAALVGRPPPRRWLRAMPLLPLIAIPAVAYGRRAVRRLRAATAAGEAAASLEPPRVRDRDRFFHDDEFDYAFQLLLGAAYRRGADPGELFATALQVRDGSAESWFTAWTELGGKLQSRAERAFVQGHRISARQAFLRAATAYAAALPFVEQTRDPTRLMPTWKQHRSCWERFVELHPMIERVEIPYPEHPLPGYLFKADESGDARPLLLLNNGSDAPTSAMWLWGGAAALERGYNALAFDGPGQQASLFLGEMGFRPDWEVVIKAVVDFAVTRREVDPSQIALAGVSQGGYWAARAAAFEERLAALVLDPGVMDVSTAWLERLPPRLLQLLDRGERSEFNHAIGFAMESSRKMRARLEARMRPYRLETPYDVFQAVRQYNLRDVVQKIRCPVLLLDPEGEQFWPGQSQQVYDALTGPKSLVRFTREEGGDMHCEPRAQAIREQRVFDWLDQTVR